MNRPLDREFLNPLDVARGARDRAGLVFLDSVISGEESLVAVEPDLVVRGRDWDRLEAELAARSGSVGAAIGWVAFDGEFHFGFYERVHRFLHRESRWVNPPEMGPGRPGASGSLAFRPLVSREEFLFMVERAKVHIAAGDIYQVCLSHPFQAEAKLSAWDYYESLRQWSPAPYAAFLDTGDRQIASASPECFLQFSGRRVITRPIKGTRPRKSDAADDRRSAADLLASAKEVAELVMITDLERNDLGQVCEFGSVEVTELAALEAYRQVYHLVSTVEGRLRPGVSHVRALQACFPGGSISGAPKKRALEIIHELERHPRGVYTGAIGYFGFQGESRFSIAIRTAIFENGLVRFHAGAGIVADSIPEKEWQETLDKASGLLLAGAGDPGQ